MVYILRMHQSPWKQECVCLVFHFPLPLESQCQVDPLVLSVLWFRVKFLLQSQISWIHLKSFLVTRILVLKRPVMIKALVATIAWYNRLCKVYADQRSIYVSHYMLTRRCPLVHVSFTLRVKVTRSTVFKKLTTSILRLL